MNLLSNNGITKLYSALIITAFSDGPRLYGQILTIFVMKTWRLKVPLVGWLFVQGNTCRGQTIIRRSTVCIWVSLRHSRTTYHVKLMQWYKVEELKNIITVFKNHFYRHFLPGFPDPRIRVLYALRNQVTAKCKLPCWDHNFSQAHVEHCQSFQLHELPGRLYSSQDWEAEIHYK